MMVTDPTAANGKRQAAGGYGPPDGGGYGGPPGGGGYGPPPGGGFGAPPGGGFGPPAGYPPAGGPMMPGAGGDVNTTLPLILGIVQIVVCCNPIFGGVSVFFALQAGNAKSAGDIATAQAKAKTAMLVIVIGAVVEALAVVLQVVVSATQ